MRFISFSGKSVWGRAGSAGFLQIFCADSKLIIESCYSLIRASWPYDDESENFQALTQPPFRGLQKKKNKLLQRDLT